MEARRRLGELLEGVFYRGDEVVIERAGKRMGVVIPATRYDMIERQRREARAALERVWAANADVPLEVIEAEVAEAIAAVRKEMQEEARRKTA